MRAMTRAQGLFAESDVLETKALRPDAIFTLRFPNEPEGQNRAHFFYEADRQTEASTRIVEKLRVYHQYVVQQRRAATDFGFRRVRAVLIETISEEWVQGLKEAARQPVVSGAPSPLFWFTSSNAIGTDRAQSSSKTNSDDTHHRILSRAWSSASDGVCRALVD
jgi:hypothetical protein